jgi:hypothetical protein
MNLRADFTGGFVEGFMDTGNFAFFAGRGEYDLIVGSLGEGFGKVAKLGWKVRMQ